MKKAVCIGINYFGTTSQLNGCINDAHDMKELLIEKQGYNAENILMLTDAPGTLDAYLPTRANILAAMAWLVKGMQPGDKATLSYSGHGYFVADRNNDETDGRDELMCAVDGAVLDDQIFQVLVKPVPKGAKLTCFFDCCHSGSIVDLKYNFKREPGDRGEAYKLIVERAFDAPGNVVMYSGCQDHQVSMDAVMGAVHKIVNGQWQHQSGRPCGAFTHSLLESIHENATHADMIKQINKTLKKNNFEQISQFSCSSPDLLEEPFDP